MDNFLYCVECVKKTREIFENDDFYWVHNFLSYLARIDVEKYDTFLFELRVSFESEYNKDFSHAAERYINAYEEIKYELPNSEFNKAKNFLKKRISKMKYNDALEYYNDENHLETAIDLFQEYINDEYMTNDIKLDCQVKLVSALYKRAEFLCKYENYQSASEYFEKALNIINSNWKVKNRFGYLDNLKSKLEKIYEKLAIEKWKKYDYKKNNYRGCLFFYGSNISFSKICEDYFSNMEAAIYYLKKAENLGKSVPLKKNLELFYYLYRAHNEPESNRTYNLDRAKEFAESGINISDLYNKSIHITSLKNCIEQKAMKISNLNSELHSINNDINNIQSLIDVKKFDISNKNNDINALNNLADSLISKSQDINSESKNIINDGEKQVEKVRNNIKEKKNFLEEIKKLEKEKKEDKEINKNNNENLKQKNAQLILILTNLESKLN